MQFVTVAKLGDFHILHLFVCYKNFSDSSKFLLWDVFLILWSVKNALSGMNNLLNPYYETGLMNNFLKCCIFRQLKNKLVKFIKHLLLCVLQRKFANFVLTKKLTTVNYAMSMLLMKMQSANSHMSLCNEKQLTFVPFLNLQGLYFFLVNFSLLHFYLGFKLWM